MVFLILENNLKNHFSKQNNKNYLIKKRSKNDDMIQMSTCYEWVKKEIQNIIKQKKKSGAVCMTERTLTNLTKKKTLTNSENNNERN